MLANIPGSEEQAALLPYKGHLFRKRLHILRKRWNGASLRASYYFRWNVFPPSHSALKGNDLTHAVWPDWDTMLSSNGWRAGN